MKTLVASTPPSLLSLISFSLPSSGSCLWLFVYFICSQKMCSFYQQKKKKAGFHTNHLLFCFSFFFVFTWQKPDFRPFCDFDCTSRLCCTSSLQCPITLCLCSTCTHMHGTENGCICMMHSSLFSTRKNKADCSLFSAMFFCDNPPLARSLYSPAYTAPEGLPHVVVSLLTLVPLLFSSPHLLPRLHWCHRNSREPSLLFLSLQLAPCPPLS